MSAPAPDVRTVDVSTFGTCPGLHARLIVCDMESRPHGGHLRVQRRVAGISVRELATAAGWSATRVRTLEGSLRVTDRAVCRYLGGLRAAWEHRAEQARTEEQLVVAGVRAGQVAT